MTPLPECPIATAIVVIGDKWKIQIMRELTINVAGCRYSELKHAIPHISDKMLSKSLKALQHDHIINKESLPTAPPQTNYTLTAIGRQLSDVLVALKKWGEQYQQQVTKEQTNESSSVRPLQ